MKFQYVFDGVGISEDFAEKVFYSMGEKKGWDRGELVITWDNRHCEDFRETISEMTDWKLEIIPEEG